MERWRGASSPRLQVSAGASSSAVRLRGNSIEFQLDDVRVHRIPAAARNADVIESLQRARLRGVRR